MVVDLYPSTHERRHNLPRHVPVSGLFTDPIKVRKTVLSLPFLPAPKSTPRDRVVRLLPRRGGLRRRNSRELHDGRSQAKFQLRNNN
jgi:hypothetical protein